MRYLFATAALFAAGLLGFSAPAQAGTITTLGYVGQDDGASISGPFPNSGSAKNTFLAAAAAYGVVDVHGFGAQPLGYSTNNTWLDGSGTFTLNSAQTGTGFGISNTNNICPAGSKNLCGFNIGSGNDKFLSLAGGSATFTMANPTNSFGFFATGVQTKYGNTFTVSFTDSDGVNVLNIPINVNGGTEYFGFTDTAVFSSVTISRPPDPTNGNDFWGIDNVAFNTTPLPAALPLFASGLGGLGLLGWRRKKKKVAAVST